MSRVAPVSSRALSIVFDVVLVVVFVLIGRSSHSEGFSIAGTLNTAWPFLAGLLVGWLALRAWLRPRQIVWTGIGVWLSTVVVGLVLRAVSDQGVQLSFAIVTAVLLAIFLLGWRALSSLIIRRSGRARARA